MNVRRSAAALAATAVLCAATGTAAAPAALADDSAPAAPSAAPSADLPSGLYGTSDPTYDGVFRQSYALLAQDTAGVSPASVAVEWLAGQQCADGGFAAFRADTGKKCGAKTPVDSNSTAAAVQAFAALGTRRGAVAKSVDWLKSVQNPDGGWGYNPGLPSDVNSTGVVIGALVAAGEKPDGVHSAKGGKSPGDALTALSLSCKDGGAFGLRDAKSGKLSANADATAAGVLGGLGRGQAAAAGATAGDPVCRRGDGFDAEQASVNGTRYLLDAFKTSPYLKSALPGAKDQPDYGNTADAVVALAASGHKKAAAAPLAWLQDHAADWAKQSGPAAWAQLVFAAHATGATLHDFGGTDLVKALDATGPAPRATAGTGTAAGAEDGKATQKADEADKNETDSGGVGVWWIIGVFLVAGIGIGIALSTRGKRRP